MESEWHSLSFLAQLLMYNNVSHVVNSQMLFAFKKPANL